MKKMLVISAALAMIGGVQVAQAAVTTYNVLETFYEPDTQPNDTIFKGAFDYDDATKTVSNLRGFLSESMTGGSTGYPNDTMNWLPLNYQLSSVYDATLGGLLVTSFYLNSTNVFSGGGFAPGGKRTYGNQNAYAMIFVNTTNPLAPLTQAQINKLAYADCTAGGLMGPTCMTGTTVAGYGTIGSMSGYPVSQVITPAVPEPESYAMILAGLGVTGFIARRRRKAC